MSTLMNPQHICPTRGVESNVHVQSHQVGHAEKIKIVCRIIKYNNKL